MITLKEFNFIKKNCDFILKNTQNYILIANNSLNIIKGHPYHLSVFEFSFLFVLKRLVFNFAKLIFDLVISLGNIFKKKISSDKKFKTLLVSNLINIKDLNKNDYIYGNLEQILKRKKISFHKLIVNHTNYSNSAIEKQIKYEKNISVIDFRNHHFLYNLKLTLSQVMFFLFSLTKSIIFFKKFDLLIGIDFLSPSTKRNLNISKNFKEITKNFSYDKIILPYEGYSWERLILMNSYNKDVERIGYNFSAISKYQHSLFRKLKKRFEPDIIFTVGKYSQKKFKKKLNIPTYVLGSVRKFNKKGLKIKKSKKTNILVLPEGIVSECKKLFHFSIICAKNNPLNNFIWRLHPSQKFESILRKMNIKKNLMPKNIILSKSNFFDDVSKSSYCIYRGSTSVITAIQNEVYPLYYNANEEMNIDPTFDLKIWKTEINNSADFQKFISFKYGKVGKKIKEKKIAKKFVEQYFQKMDSKAIINKLKN